MEMWPNNYQTLKSSSGFGVDGGTASTPLYLTGDPTQEPQAVPKQYVDYIVNNIPASKVDTGTLAVARLPAFTGDVTSVAGTGNLTLTNTGVTPGTWQRYVVDTKGRVTAGSNLLVTDVPDLDWSKITTGKPTTLAGYGITNGFAKTGGVLTGYLSDQTYPSQPLHASNKDYVDNWFTGSSSELTGSVVKMATEVTPVGFLRCNGSVVSKTQYSALNQIIGGNLPSPYNTVPGEGSPWVNQYQINSSQSQDLTGWATNTPFTTARSGHKCLVTKNRVYVIGGTGSSGDEKTYTAPINADGTIGAWSEDLSLPGVLRDAVLFTVKDKVYLATGFNDRGVTVGIVYVSDINADGTLAGWSFTTSVSYVRRSAQVLVTKSRVYLIGGILSNGAATSSVVSAPINTDGTLGSWTSGTSLPANRFGVCVVTTKNMVHVIGGHSGVGMVRTVYTAPINADGTLGAWTTGTNIPSDMCNASAVVVRNRVYLLGSGYNNADAVSRVLTAPINSDGTLGTWTTGTSLPGGLFQSSCFITQQRIYMVAGRSVSGDVSVVYSAPFSGGANDYSTYYSTGYAVTDPDNFALPDYSSLETTGLKYYIKY